MSEREEMLSRQLEGLSIFDDCREGSPVVVSRLVMRGEMLMQEIEMACDMPESEASQTLNELVDMDLVTVRSMDEGKVGRPRNQYKMTNNWRERISNLTIESVVVKLEKLQAMNMIVGEKGVRNNHDTEVR